MIPALGCLALQEISLLATFQSSLVQLRKHVCYPLQVSGLLQVSAQKASLWRRATSRTITIVLNNRCVVFKQLAWRKASSFKATVKLYRAPEWTCTARPLVYKLSVPTKNQLTSHQKKRKQNRQKLTLPVWKVVFCTHKLAIAFAVVQFWEQKLICFLSCKHEIRE